VHIANTAAPTIWEGIRSTLCHALIHGKDDRVCDIIANAHSDKAVFFLQEASASFVRAATQHPALSQRYALLLPDDFDGTRDQNSVILLDRFLFCADGAADVTQPVLQHVGGDFLAAGDLFTTSVRDAAGTPWLLASFHGDSNGLSTQPVLAGLHRACRALFPAHRLLAGIDANTSSHPHDRFHQGVDGFRRFLAAHGMVSSWDEELARDPFVKTTPAPASRPSSARPSPTAAGSPPPASPSRTGSSPTPPTPPPSGPRPATTRGPAATSPPRSSPPPISPPTTPSSLPPAASSPSPPPPPPRPTPPPGGR
jgi:hypothetical protein